MALALVGPVEFGIIGRGSEAKIMFLQFRSGLGDEK